MSHPAACPYCGSTIVNQASLDYQLRPARLNQDGSITIGDTKEGSDFKGPAILFCHGCSSEYPQPDDVPEHFVPDFPDPVEAAWEFGVRAPSKGDPKYLGHTVRWSVEPVLNTEVKHG